MMRRALLAVVFCPTLAISAQAEALSAHNNYLLRCSGCHGRTGAGSQEGGIPEFRNSVSHIAATDLGRTYLMHVPGVVSTGLDDAEISKVMNYVLDTWGDGTHHFSSDEVHRRRALPVADVVELRKQLAAELSEKGIALAAYPWP
ncbi:cytochrome C [Thioclava dalianensis]|uniref:Cytochrome C n=1 Tax=Thioclava dalianensis TaxID=1185766 RepID=A0A074TLT7_9RHOB|nr:hypothetical protein [Thioclava dalianensis]KEP69958.1 cytochrome C [Thioclava dalianensis]SFN18121.1 hypothetical protein SAMN05216224_102839 [Thioclava dalianensis]